MYHVVGMDQSGHIISINTDPNADIFDTSDVIVVEDFRKVVPELIKEIKSRLKGQLNITIEGGYHGKFKRGRAGIEHLYTTTYLPLGHKDAEVGRGDT
jgi:hypothetical protein